MRIYLANYEPDRRGGGWTQARYLFEGLNCTTDYDSADIYLITGPTMANYDQVERAKQDGKKIVLRADNAVRDSRNRGTGMTRMKTFADMADLIIYQSKWARDFLMPYTKKDGVVILNGVSSARFYPIEYSPIDNESPPQSDSYLYVRSSRDEGKQWLMAWYWFIQHFAKNPRSHLTIVGRFSSENTDWNFDFYNNERYRFEGELSAQNMSIAYQTHKYFLYTYLNDACSNTLLEARASGCEIVDVYGMLQTGGAPEIMASKDISVERMIIEYEQALASL